MRGACLAALIAVPLCAGAQEGGAIPYPADGEPRGPAPAQSDPTYVPPEEYPYEKEDRGERLSGIDDPGVGLFAEFIGAAMFVEAARGSLVDARFGFGGRLTWDWGRILPNETLRQALFADIQYLYTSWSEGTSAVFADTRFHYLTIAPAYTFPFGEGSPYGFYLQVGAGIALSGSTLSIDGERYSHGGLQPLLQYGLGIRGKPRLGGVENLLRLTFRIELTRYRRGYADDTYLGGAVGVGF